MKRRLFMQFGIASFAEHWPRAYPPSRLRSAKSTGEWRKILPPQQFRILREGTEWAGSSVNKE